MQSDIKKIITPTLGQFVGFILASILLLIALHNNLIEQRFLSQFTEATILKKEDASAVLEAYYNRFNDSMVLSSLVLGMFWGMVGLLAYTFLWVLGNIFIELINFYTYEKYYIHKPTLLKQIKLFCWKMFLAATCLSLMIITIQFSSGLWMSLFAQFIVQSVSLYSISLMLVSICGLALNLYILLVVYLLFRSFI